LWLRSRIFKNVRFPIDGVIVPVRPSEVRLSTVTLCLCLRLQLTPGHEQKSVVAFHAARTPAWLLRLALNASKVSTSVLLLTVLADTDWNTYGSRTNRRRDNIDDAGNKRRNANLNMLHGKAVNINVY